MGLIDHQKDWVTPHVSITETIPTTLIAGLFCIPSWFMFKAITTLMIG